MNIIQSSTRFGKCSVQSKSGVVLEYFNRYNKGDNVLIPLPSSFSNSPNGPQCVERTLSQT